MSAVSVDGDERLYVSHLWADDWNSPEDEAADVDTVRPELLSAAFDLARKLGDPEFRRYLKAVGWGRAVERVVVCLDTDTIGDVLRRAAGCEGSCLVAISDAGEEHGFRFARLETKPPLQGGLERSIGSVIGWLDEVSGPPGQAGVAVLRRQVTRQPAMVLFGAELRDALSAAEGQLVEVSGELWRLPDGEVCEVKKVTGVEVIPTSPSDAFTSLIGIDPGYCDGEDPVKHIAQLRG